MSKIPKLILILLFISVAIITFIRSDFKETKRNSKKIAEDIKTYHLNNIDNIRIDNTISLEDFKELKNYLIKRNNFYNLNSEKYKIKIQFGTKDYFEKYYKIGIEEVLIKNKSIKINSERKFFLKKNLVRIYKFDNDRYLKVISDNSFFLTKILLKFLIIISLISATIICLNELIKRSNFIFQKKIIDSLNKLKIENSDIYIFVILMGLINILFPSMSSKYWYLWYFLIILYFFFLYQKKIELNLSNILILPIIVIPIIIISFFSFFYNFGYMSSGTNFDFTRKLILLISLIPFIFYLLKKAGLSNIHILLALILSFSFIQFRSLSLNIIKIEDLIILNILLFSNFFLIMKKNFNNYLFFICFLILVPIICILAFRTDYLFMEEKGFHLSYYVGPIISQLEFDGFRLLVDQPSQYGFLNLLIPSLINYKSALTSFHVFQSSLLITTSLIVFYLIIKSNIKINKIFAYISFITLLFLSDPYLIGPNPYPSSSVIRFFPVYLFILFINNTNLDLMSRISINKIILVSIMLGFAFMWSIEVFFYVSFPFVIYFVFNLFSNYEKKSYIPSLRNVALILISTIIVISVIFFGYKYLNNLDNINFYMHYMHVIGYGKGYATVSLTPFSPVLILIVPLFIILKKNKINNFRLFYFIFLIIALLSYFFGRAVPNNILALFPIYFLIMALMTSFFELKEIKILLIPLIIIISISQFSIFKNVEKVTLKNLQPSFSLTDINIPTYNIVGNDFSDGLRGFVVKIPNTKKVSVISFGDSMKNGIRSDGNKAFLPNPWTLIASPLKKEISKKILVNSKKFSEREGYLIYDRKWDYHYNELISVIKEIKNCSIEYSDERFEVYNCNKGLIN